MMSLVERVRALVTLSSSYVLRRPINTLRGAQLVRAPLALAALPAAATWAAALAASGALTALRIGIRVRRVPVLRESRAVLANVAELVPVVTLVSDTHVVAPRRSPVELEADRAQWPWGDLPSHRAIASGLRRVLAHVFRNAPRTVVWCGDEVDTGDELEWRLWRDVVEAVPGLAHRLLPGNHDLCFNRPYDEDYTLARRALRERAYQAHAGVHQRLADFPIVDTIVTEAPPATIVLLDSCRHRSEHVLSNAIGYFADDQLDELERLLAHTRGPLLVAAHHHVWRDERFAQPESWYETALDSDRLIAILCTYRRRAQSNHVLVCHGHRHCLTAGTVGEPAIDVVGLPSTTLGDKSGTGRLDGVLRYAIAGLRRNGGWAVAIREVGVLSDPDTRASDGGGESPRSRT